MKAGERKEKDIENFTQSISDCQTALGQVIKTRLLRRYAPRKDEGWGHCEVATEAIPALVIASEAKQSL